MTLANIKDVRSLIAKYSFRPLKHLGQNFLVSEKVLEIFISACSLTKKDAVLEIGPGIGTITRELAKRCRTVLAIEKDERLLPILKENVREFRNVSITLSDARRLSPNDLPIKKYHLVASFPYYAAAYLLNHFLYGLY